jgi:hypothetical protein
MGQDRFARKLQWFKENEKPEAVLLVAGNQVLTKLVIVWGHTRVDRTDDPPPLEDESDHSVWEWLWANVRFSEEELFSGSGLAGTRVEERLRQLVSNRIIYPDGTCNSFVQRYLRQQVLGLLDPKGKGRSVAKAKS